MTDSVCTAYESQKQCNNSLTTIKGTVLMTKYIILFNACILNLLFV